MIDIPQIEVRYMEYVPSGFQCSANSPWKIGLGVGTIAYSRIALVAREDNSQLKQQYNR